MAKKNKKEKEREQATKRQQEKRAKDQERYGEMGLREKRFTISETENEWLDELREFRGGYDVGEYLSTLIRRDKQRMDEERKQLGSCEFCGEPLPAGCKNGLGIPSFKGRGECFYTREERKLRL